MTYGKKRLLAVASMLVLILCLCSCSNSGDASETGDDNTPDTTNTTETSDTADSNSSTVVLAQSADPSTLDPHRPSGDTGANIFRNICEPLTTFNGKNELEPSLAESWERISENEWVFKIKEGIQFSNGEPLNAEAVGWNLERGMSDEYPRQSLEYRSYYDSYEVVDEYTIKVITKTPDFQMPEHMSDMYIIAPAYSEKIGEEAVGSDPVGTGPYIFESWTPDQQIVLKENPNYWQGDPEIDTFIIRTIPEAASRVAELVNGTIDIIYDPNFEYLDMLEAEGNINIANKIYRRIAYVDFNTTDWSPNPELKDKRVRQAINYAVDKEAIIESVMGGYAYEVASIWRPDFPEYDTEIKGYEYNPEKARELLAEAGYADGFSITLQSSTLALAKAHEVNQAVAQYLADVGITCTVETLEENAARSIVINGQDQQKVQGMFSWNWASKPTLYESWLTGIVHSTGMSSYNHIEGYDELIDEILSLDSHEERAPLLVEMQHKLIDDPPFLYLFQMSLIYATNDRINWDANDFQYMLAYEMKLA